FWNTSSASLLEHISSASLLEHISSASLLEHISSASHRTQCKIGNHNGHLLLFQSRGRGVVEGCLFGAWSLPFSCPPFSCSASSCRLQGGAGRLEIWRETDKDQLNLIANTSAGVGGHGSIREQPDSSLSTAPQPQGSVKQHRQASTETTSFPPSSTPRPHNPPPPPPPPHTHTHTLTPPPTSSL
uniref:Uncharacterized protein n=1 Tax=Oncorhynchus kisutch TaxID=8019 RepID=A0A8C7D2K0_ONCKI